MTPDGKSRVNYSHKLRTFCFHVYYFLFLNIKPMQLVVKWALDKLKLFTSEVMIFFKKKSVSYNLLMSHLMPMWVRPTKLVGSSEPKVEKGSCLLWYLCISMVFSFGEKWKRQQRVKLSILRAFEIKSKAARNEVKNCL